MGYSGAFVFGDSLVDSGNALKLAQWYGTLTFSDLPEGAPTPDKGYFAGRFSNGYEFTDLLSNRYVGQVTKPIFPFHFEDPWLGTPVAPFAGDPSGNNLNFAYGGAQIIQGKEVVPDLDDQTDAFRDAVDGHADPNALYMIAIGGNDVRSLAPAGSDPVAGATARAELDHRADVLIHEVTQLVGMGAHNFLLTGIPNVGLIPKYDIDLSGSLNATEQLRASAATEYSIYLDQLIRTKVLPALAAAGANVTYVPLMDYTDGNGRKVTGALTANMGTLAVLNGVKDPAGLASPGEYLAGHLLQFGDTLFFDSVHPNAQAHALLASYMHAKITRTTWVETMPLLGNDTDYRVAATIGAAGEIDRASLLTVAGTTYTFQMLGVSTLTPHVLGQLGSVALPAGQILADPSLRLLSSAGTVLASNNDSGIGFDARLVYLASTTGQSALQMSAVGSLTGAYVLTISVDGTAMQAGNGYTVNSASMLVIEGRGGTGVDTVSASVSYALAAGSEIEILQTTNAKGKTALNLTGNEFNQQILGNSGSNMLEGKGGIDEYRGGAGSDRFVLSALAVSIRDGSQIDRILDYGSGDVVDVSQILKVGAGTNVLSGGYLRVTTTGLIQVDVNGGGDDWATLSTINGTGAVSVQYLAGGALTKLSVPRTVDRSAVTSATNFDGSSSELHVLGSGLHTGSSTAEYWL